MTWTDVGEVDELKWDEDDEDEEEVVEDDDDELDEEDVDDFELGLLFNCVDSISSDPFLLSIESDVKVSFAISVWLAPGLAFVL